MFLHDIPANAAGIARLAASEPAFAAIDRGRFEWTRRDAGFGGLLQMILGQQVSTRAADAMWRTLSLLMPEPDPVRFLTLDDAQLAAAGFSRQKAGYGRAIAATLIADPAYLDRIADMDDAAAIETLTALPGIGRWSAEIYLMFCLGRPDIWPAGDLGIVLGLQYLLDLPERPKPERVIALGEAWRPYRSAAALLVWRHYAEVAADKRREQRRAARGSKL